MSIYNKKNRSAGRLSGVRSRRPSAADPEAVFGDVAAGRPVAHALWFLIPLLVAGCASDTAPPELTWVDRVLVEKSERRMRLLRDGKVVREYRIALGDQPKGHKMEEGDERTPEGEYILDWRNPNSRFYKSIHVSYPNERDAKFSRFIGVNPGGMIMIHGQPNYLRSAKAKAEYLSRDWTDGCIAVQNHEMDEIWRSVRDGTPIEIRP